MINIYILPKVIIPWFILMCTVLLFYNIFSKEWKKKSIVHKNIDIVGVKMCNLPYFA